MHQLRLFFIALQFFTRIPIPRWVGFEQAWLHHASRYFPLVGLVVGAVAATVYLAASQLWPAPVAVLLSSAASIYLTGAFHEDGFADMCDGFGGGLTRERVLEIMKDSRIGTYGAVGAGLLIALKCTLLAHLPVAAAVAALLVAHPLSRLAAASLIWRLQYARDDGKAKPLAQEMSSAEFSIALACAMLPLIAAGTLGYLAWATLAACVAAAAVVAAWLGIKCVRRIGGYTGDCLGAVQQVSEVAIYLCIAASLAD
ncbi:adenosylcobinamide-GDP ribazoletransferase [Massilia sp. PAMC28688]|uniref:adenosylcobinamide-GDP ribazoletransferase n=1 Tax=Massilia sp. PAMC28688 TaxID=2861283 RepID=UPI001C63576A|nr:adenosylcobinamide-GDP ribazoletransferase [Massilia sp. PAMC28688]QYF94589.1 adenosylcobinamide-GDP ribazoletransferase [Massilia sp. PAMC28688]